MLVTGALAGAGAIGLLALLSRLEHAVWGGSTAAGAFAAASPHRRIAAVLCAGVITTIFRLLIRRNRAAQGALLERLWEEGGIISLGQTVTRSLLSIVDVGLGAALGREGALKDIGGALGSRIALGAKLDLGRRRLLVACGMAAGIASAYNVPVGGALFGLEVLLGRIEMETVVPMIVCCATATTVSRSVLGNMPAYHIPPFDIGGAGVLAQSLLFGVAVGAISALVLKGLRGFTSVEDRNPRLAPLMPMLALGALGVASMWLPELLGNGYQAATAALHHNLGAQLLMMLALLRFVATAVCAAARVPGGLFTPMLSIGALTGAFLGETVCRAWPGTPPGAFALLGMGALLAGTTRGPISSVVLIAELSNDYGIILPLAFACGAAALVSRGLERGSLYRLGRGGRATRRPELPSLGFIHPARTALRLECAAELLLDVLTPDPRPLFVVDERGRLRGTFHPETARQRLAAESFRRLLVVDDLADHDGPSLSVRTSRDQARALFAAPEAPSFLPVVDDAGLLVGEACRDDFVN